jgi:lysophospholipase L1-like esterase
MKDKDKNYRSNIARILLLGSGFVFVLSALLYNEFFLTLLDSNPPLLEITVEKIRLVQIYFLSSGLVLIVLSECTRRISWLEDVVTKSLMTNIFFSVLIIFLPLSILELSLKPFMISTTIFMRDSELGWKLMPNSEDAWGGVVVTINGKGLRGPELNYAKSSDVRRILYLGDSVTFGYKLATYEQTFPYLIEAILEDRLTSKIETINAGVGGYSPWQEYVYLAREGIKYNPDLIIVSFVLNDVTEKFGLVKFGGTHKGKQLERSVSSVFDWLIHKSSIVYFTRKISARMRFGSNIQQGAKQKEILDVRSLIYYSDRPGVQRAWTVTLENLGKIFTFSKEKDIPILLVIFPYMFQFDDINALSAPQNIVSQYALDNEVPVIDLLPILSEKEQGVKPEGYFLGELHLSLLGNEVVAEIIANFIRNEGLLIPESVMVLPDTEARQH